MLLQQVALVSQAPSVTLPEVVKVSAALQKQATRDFSPSWEVSATVDAFDSLEDVPLGYWPIVVRDDVISNWQAQGIHLDDNGQPFALVQASSGWPMTASHEVLEMLADPFGERVIAGKAPKEAKNMGRVEYLVEVCDPSEAEEFGYTVNEIQVSDFYTPDFFDPVKASGVRYSFTGALLKPREILRGGYISFHNTVDDHWYQVTWFSGPKPALRDLGIFDESSMSTREWIDQHTETPLMKKQSRVTVRPRQQFSSLVARSMAPRATSGRARKINAKIARLLKTK